MNSPSTSRPESGPLKKSELERNITIGFAQLNRPKQDDKGQIYREIRCLACRSWLGDEYVFSGRLKLKCFRCGNVIVMEFKHKKDGLRGSNPGDKN